MNEKQTDKFNDLFDKAKSENSKHSFEDTKTQFISSINLQEGQVVNKTIFSGLSLKIWIMISVIIGLGVLAFLNVPNNGEAFTPKETNINQLILSDSIMIQEEQAKVFEEYFIAKGIEKELTVSINESIIEDSLELPIEGHFLVELPRAKTPLTNTDKNLEEEYRFPKLNAAEIKANNKQKKRMTKALGRRNNKYYAYIPSSSQVFSGKKVSVQSFLMSCTEVTNLEYRTFLFDLLISGRKDDFLTAKPDQEMWVKEYPGSHNEPMQRLYFSHEAYDKYPIVGVSRRAAEMYCVWLTIETNKIFAEKHSALNDVRIPTNYEWMIAARGGVSDATFPWEDESPKNAKGCYLANYNPETDNMKADGAFHPARVRSYLPNEYGLFCMSGNVAEMVYYSFGSMGNHRVNPGTKGGSWTSSAEELEIEGSDRFSGQVTPSVNIGFRVVITYLTSTVAGK